MPIRKRWSHHNVRIVGPSWDSMPEDLSRVEFPRKCTCRQFESYLRSSIIHLSVFPPKCAYFSSAYLVRSCDCAKPDCLCSSTIVWMFALYPNVCMTYMYCNRMFVWRVCIVSEWVCDVYVLYPNVCVTCLRRIGKQIFYQFEQIEDQTSNNAQQTWKTSSRMKEQHLAHVTSVVA